MFWPRQNIATGEKQLANTGKTIKLDKLVGLLRRSISRTAEFAQEFQISDKRSHQHRSGCHISESAKTVAIHQARSFHYLAPDARTAAGLSKTLTIDTYRSVQSRKDFCAKHPVALGELLFPTALKLVSVVVNNAIQRCIFSSVGLILPNSFTCALPRRICHGARSMHARANGGF